MHLGKRLKAFDSRITGIDFYDFQKILNNEIEKDLERRKFEEALEEQEIDLKLEFDRELEKEKEAQYKKEARRVLAEEDVMGYIRSYFMMRRGTPYRAILMYLSHLVTVSELEMAAYIISKWKW